MDNEIWKDIEGFPKYKVSNFGRVKSLHKNKELIMKLCDHYKGYKTIFLYKTDLKKDFKCFVHRLVAGAFIENHLDKPYVNHIDCNKKNNHHHNLEWATEAENSQWYQKNKNNEPGSDLPF